MIDPNDAQGTPASSGYEVNDFAHTVHSDPQSSAITYYPDKPAANRTVFWIIGAAVVFLAAVIGFILIGAAGESNGAADDEISEVIVGEPEAKPAPQDDNEALSQDQMRAELSALARRDADDTHAKGDVNAPIVIIEYADLTCPYCGVFTQDTLPQIVENYVDNGLVRIEWRDLPLFGEPSAVAAFGGRAAGAQGKFWEYQEALYAAEIPRDQVDAQAVLNIAREIGIEDIDSFKAAMTSDDFAKLINRDYSEAQQLGVAATPTFLVNGYPVEGAQPYENFERIIEDELDALGIKR